MADPIRHHYDLDDTGTRYQQYSELIEIWETGIEILERRRIVTRMDQIRVIQLRSAMEMLRLTMSGMGGYHDQVETLQDQINMIPTSQQLAAEKMPGDRGTPLKPWTKLLTDGYDS